MPREGFEPSRPYGQRILRTLERSPSSLTKRYEPVFTRLAVVKGSFGLASYQQVRPPSWPHLPQICARTQSCETDYLSFGHRDLCCVGLDIAGSLRLLIFAVRRACRFPLNEFEIEDKD